MAQEKREINPQSVIRGVLSFLRADTITSSFRILHGAFLKLRNSGNFPLLQNVLFHNDQSRQLDEEFSSLYRTGVIRFANYSGTKYLLEREVLISIRRRLPERFTAEEIVQLSIIAERLEEMIAT